MTDFYLLTKPECPLCTEALLAVHHCQPEEPVRLHIVDITQQPELLEEYAWLVPVLVRHSDDAELRWPFGNELEEFLNS
ncbi:glutaredoxin family protein [Pseudidiomarina sp.]|uniref:glutaredoxin family protein n=1 Tax=Pseudidiomarina sp. TaxID=2081707 RepID=UPI00299DF607|nr:glutaredoxin family protein [Pseudidiomarina sp.]MDX1705012.1 glutaredoxin family protein [Pseudidiomarina sp.]